MKALFVLLCFSFPLAAMDMVMEADDLAYNEHQIQLSGHVRLGHPLGLLRAGEASLAKGDDESFGLYPYVRLTGQVKLDLKDGASLQCQLADLNFLDSTGFFSGDTQIPHVEFVEERPHPRHGPIPIKLKGRSLKVHLVRDKERQLLTDLLASGDIELQYDHDFMIHADKATYRSVEHVANGKSTLSGIIHLMPATSKGACHFRYGKQVYLEAGHIEVNSDGKLLSLADVKGTIGSLTHGDRPETWQVEASRLYWDEERRSLTLKGAVSLQSQEIGAVKTSDEVTILLSPANEPFRIKQVQGQGVSRFVFKESSHG